LSFETKSVKSKQFSDTSNFFQRPRGLRKIFRSLILKTLRKKKTSTNLEQL